MDVIFCRNVLMYFTAQRAKNVARNFHRSLAEDGWLIVNPTETSAALFPLFTPVEFPGAVLYRKTKDNAPAYAAIGYQTPALQPDLSPAETVQLLAPAERQPEPPEQAATMAPGDTRPHGQDDREALSLRARTCANQGRLGEAIAWCEQAIAADKMNPARHYLLAAIQQEQGQADAAAQSLNRALYLDSGFVLAHFALGNLRLSQGRHREAERHFTNALAALRAHPHDEILPESEGLTAGRFVEIVTSALASLPRAVAAGT